MVLTTAGKRLATGLLVALALALAGSLVWGFWHRGQAQVLRTENAALVGAVRAYEADAKARAALDATQAQARAQAAKTVRATRDAIHKEEANAQEPRPTGTAGQLDRLRRLTDAANAGIRAAGKLP